MSAARHQIIRTDGSDELVVLTRAEYDALRAAAGDTEAEIRAASRMVAESEAALAAGREIVLPAWLTLPVARGEAPLKVVREHRGRTQQELASAAGLTTDRVSDMECGDDAPNAEILARLAAALDVDPAWLQAG